MQPIDLLIVCVLVISGLTVFLYRRLKASALHNNLNSAGRSKLKTLELLEERGYKIVDCDRSIEVCSIIDGKHIVISLSQILKFKRVTCAIL